MRSSLFLLAALAAGAVSACHHPLEAPIHAEGLPLILPFHLAHEGRSLEVKFNLLPERGAAGSVQPFSIGLRVGSEGAGDMLPDDMALLDAAAIPLKLELWHLSPEGAIAIPLRGPVDAVPAVVQGAGRRRTTGKVFTWRNPTSGSADEAPRTHREYAMAIADAQDLVPGRYRLKVTTLGPSPVLAHLAAHIVAVHPAAE